MAEQPLVDGVSVDAIRAQWEEHQVTKVRLGGFDLDGVLRGKYVSMEKFWSSLSDGFGFCDVIFGWDCGDALYDRGSFTGWHTGFPDLVARIDPTTCRLVPWEERTAFALCDFYRKEDRAPLPFCPRQVLKRVLDRADRLGLSP